MIIRIKNLSKSFKSQTVFSEVDLSLHSSCITGLSAPNGSGKTVFLRMLSGFIFPDKGEIYFDDKRLHKDMDYPNSLGMLLEHPKFLDSESGYENLSYLYKLNHDEDKQAIDNALIRVGLDPNLKTKFKAYSLGMKQKLGIAAAIMESPDLIFLDEPTNALDEEALERLIQILKEERDRGALIIIASHNKQFLLSVSDRCLTIKGAKFEELQMD